MNHYLSLDQLRKKIEGDIQSISSSDHISLFYQPIQYVNNLSGKMIRPLLTILSGLAVGGDLDNLLPPASAVELIHNFSLVHDDIMDQDDTRRGEPTVHMKWDIGTAILTGDGLLGLAYRKLLTTPNIEDLRLVRLFNDAVIEICEGQALDKMFEKTVQVSENEYMEMILKKTAILIKLSCQIGGIVGNGTEEQVAHLADFGLNIGLGFQIQDDLLDVIADEQDLGKKVGSDLAMNKKTILTLRLAEKIDAPASAIKSVIEFRNLLDSYKIVDDVKEMVRQYYNNAQHSLEQLTKNHYLTQLYELTGQIQSRNK